MLLLASLDFVIHHEEHFWHKDIHIDAWPFFYPVFGFLACVAMIWVSKHVFGLVLGRPDDYYQRDKQEHPPAAPPAPEQPQSPKDGP